MKLAGGCSSSHRAGDLAEDRADAGGNTRHDSARRNCDEARHQGIFNEVLASGVLPNSQLPNQIGDPCHVFFLSSDGVCSVSRSKLHRKPVRRNQQKPLERF
jgi:hypothetical protein